MLKKIRGLFLGLVVLAGSACVTPTHASSAPQVILTTIQASGMSGAKEELAVIHNNSPVDVDITGWCLKNKAGVSFVCVAPAYDTKRVIAADGSPSSSLQYLLPAYSSATFASMQYIEQSQYEASYFSFMYEVTNGSSGSMVSSNDTLQLVDTEGAVIDSFTWLLPIPSGAVWARLQILYLPSVYATNNDSNDWASRPADIPPQDALITISVSDPPEVNPPTENNVLRVTELLANPKGADAGREFIELYNSSESEVVSLAGYRLRIGLDTFKWFDFPAEIFLQPHEYRAFFNDTLGFTLQNTKGGVQLFKNAAAVGGSIQYENARDDTAWAEFEGGWEYTNMPTPGFSNVPSTEQAGDKSTVAHVTSGTAQKPCAANQYRNPATGRCKLIAHTSSVSTSCKPGQYRSSETNRCRTVKVEKGPAPCKEGQERNPETNRCRTISKMTNAGYGVRGVATKADAPVSWYYWLGIIVVVLLIVGYAVWEWRHELRAGWQRLCRLLARK